MTDEEDQEHTITNPVRECTKEQRRYNKCVRKYAYHMLGGNTEGSDECLELFDDFRECVMDAVQMMKEQEERRRKGTA
ncbi:unnamed protein product [Discosporangium mesarthrocarpum]